MIYAFLKETEKYYIDLTFKLPKLHEGVLILKLIHVYFDLSYKQEKSMNLTITLLGFIVILQMGETWWKSNE